MRSSIFHKVNYHLEAAIAELDRILGTDDATRWEKDVRDKLLEHKEDLEANLELIGELIGELDP